MESTRLRCAGSIVFSASRTIATPSAAVEENIGVTLNLRVIPFALAVLASTAAYANDTLVVLGAGGLELTKSEHIAMVSEDLYLAPSAVRVRYAFRNESDRDITTLVAFPLPDVDQGPGTNVDLPMRGQQNFVHFHVTVDGQPVQAKLEQKAIAENGADITAELANAGLPIDTSLPGYDEKVRALPDDVWRRLVKQKILDYGEGEPHRSDNAYFMWSLRATFHWEQTFPAGKAIVVDHRYKPIVGGSFVYSNAQLVEQFGSYCLDDQSKAGANHLLKAAKTQAQGDRNSVGIPAREVSYVLTSGANWRGPIGTFHLTIDKEDPKAILSTCITGLEKSNPTTFELERMNFTPKEDIRFVVFGGDS